MRRGKERNDAGSNLTKTKNALYPCNSPWERLIKVSRKAGRRKKMLSWTKLLCFIFLQSSVFKALNARFGKVLENFSVRQTYHMFAFMKLSRPIYLVQLILFFFFISTEHLHQFFTPFMIYFFFCNFHSMCSLYKSLNYCC